MFFFLVQTEQGDIFKVTMEVDEDMVSMRVVKFSAVRRFLIAQQKIWNVSALDLQIGTCKYILPPEAYLVDLTSSPWLIKRNQLHKDHKLQTVSHMLQARILIVSIQNVLWVWLR